MPRHEWIHKEQLLALRLYCQLPFGQLHQSNPDVIEVATAIERTPSAVAMKACNFASLDPAIKQKGLGNVSRSDRELWVAFQADSTAIADAAEEYYQRLIVKEQPEPELEPSQRPMPDGLTESIREVRVRRVQSFFRKSVLVNYGNRCALSGLRLPELIIASHIIPWSVDEKRRADPANGIALNPLYDRAFDQGLMTFDEQCRVILSKTLLDEVVDNQYAQPLFNIAGRALTLPNRFRPDEVALKYHRENIFQRNANHD